MATSMLVRAWIPAAVAATAAFALGGACANSDTVQGTSEGTTGTGTSSQGGNPAGTGGMAQGSGGGTTTGAGGQETTTTTGSGSSDPCAGASDGDHCGVDLGGLADHNSVYHCAGGVTASTTPCSNGCQSSACVKPPQDPCASAQSGNGAYCGGTLAGGDPGSLYHCQNGVTASKDACPNGCKVNPPGVADACNPAGDPCAGAASG